MLCGSSPAPACGLYPLPIGFAAAPGCHDAATCLLSTRSSILHTRRRSEHRPAGRRKDGRQLRQDRRVGGLASATCRRRPAALVGPPTPASRGLAVGRVRGGDGDRVGAAGVDAAAAADGGDTGLGGGRTSRVSGSPGLSVSSASYRAALRSSRIRSAIGGGELPRPLLVSRLLAASVALASPVGR